MSSIPILPNVLIDIINTYAYGTPDGILMCIINNENLKEVNLADVHFEGANL